MLDVYGHLDVGLAYSVFKVDRKDMNYSTKSLLLPPPPLHFAHLPSNLKTFADCIEGHGLSLCKNPKYYHNIHVSSFLPFFAAVNGMLFVG